MAILLALSRVTGWRAGSEPIIGRPWSANDVAMVIGWVAILPHAAASFEHDILAPPVSHLSAEGNFLVASAAALAELLVAALLARVLGAATREALQRLLCLCRTRWSGHFDSYRARMPFRRARVVSLTSAVKT
jgi:hypothetical protein